MLLIVHEKINGSCFYLEINAIMHINRELSYHYAIKSRSADLVDIHGDHFLQPESNLHQLHHLNPSDS